MGERSGISEDEFDAAWKRLPESDRCFIRVLIIMVEAVGEGGLCYHEPSAEADAVLRRADRDVLFSLTVECVGRLFEAPALERIKRSRGRRKNGQSVREVSRRMFGVGGRGGEPKGDTP